MLSERLGADLHARPVLNNKISASEISRKFLKSALLVGFFLPPLQQGRGEHRWPSGHYDVGDWDQGLRHGPAVYFHPDGGREEATYVEGYEQGPSTVHFARWVSSRSRTGNPATLTASLRQVVAHNEQKRTSKSPTWRHTTKSGNNTD